MSLFIRMLNSAVDLIFPPVCLHCHTRIKVHKAWICNACYEKLSFIPEQHCPKCGYPTEEGECSNCAENHYSFKQAVSVFSFQEVTRTLIHELKYTGYTGIADWFANQMYIVLLKEKTLMEIDFVIAVPLHRVRKRERSFNQSELIARALAKRMNKVYTNKAVRRKVFTKSQTMLNSTSRRKNLAGAFEIGSLNPKGLSFLLIDDVFTTGTTVNEVTKVLLSAGTKQVFVMTACHGI